MPLRQNNGNYWLLISFRLKWRPLQTYYSAYFLNLLLFQSLHEYGSQITCAILQQASEYSAKKPLQLHNEPEALKKITLELKLDEAKTKTEVEVTHSQLPEKPKNFKLDNAKTKISAKPSKIAPPLGTF